ncbi:GNAT family N-acetyltransferase [Falsiroseomonas tokyonensis]|uniref:GNAT family N-acetyltransferase n=1 Tax=Falsiroseomonas tokyonensis TaxID=430521 RepID=A0ABV7C1W0_9PROT|nr:GNAT family N-acetyltransferase [Falsiroseomonas tokyonensis]MBU8541459.1 GNAT family N-acetyltransferase [Falsiroseomonas tokyonensis]
MNHMSGSAALELRREDLAPAVTVRRVRLASSSVRDWEDFAGRCGASHHCAMGHIRFWRIFCRVELFEVFRSGDSWCSKIGQCAVAIGPRSRRFLDSLQLLPGHQDCWTGAMAAVLRALGPGTYRYGSTWSLERSRDQDLRDLAGVSIDHVACLAVQAVDFARWASWDQYLSAVSNNARRNAKKAAQCHPDIVLTIHEGLDMLGKVQLLTRLRGAMCRRKKLRFNMPRQWMRAFLRALIWRRQAFIATVGVCGQTLAMFSGIHFGGNTYYLEGAAPADNEGASWYLMLAMLRQSHEQNPEGRFVMGVADPDANLSRSRDQCRVSEHPASVIAFRYGRG